jgi:hypothetical protein
MIDVAPAPNSMLFAGTLVCGGIIGALLSLSRDPRPQPATLPAALVVKAERVRAIGPPAKLDAAELLRFPTAFADRWGALTPPQVPDRSEYTVGAAPSTIATERIAVAQADVKPATHTVRDGPCAKGKRWLNRRGWKHWRCRR